MNMYGFRRFVCHNCAFAITLAQKFNTNCMYIAKSLLIFARLASKETRHETRMQKMPNAIMQN